MKEDFKMLLLPPDRIIHKDYTIWHTLVIKQVFSIHNFHSYEVIQVNPPFLLPEISFKFSSCILFLVVLLKALSRLSAKTLYWSQDHS